MELALLQPKICTLSDHLLWFEITMMVFQHSCPLPEIIHSTRSINNFFWGARLFLEVSHATEKSCNHIPSSSLTTTPVWRSMFFCHFYIYINIYVFALTRKIKDDNAYGDDESPLSRVNLLNYLLFIRNRIIRILQVSWQCWHGCISTSPPAWTDRNYKFLFPQVQCLNLLRVSV